MGHEAHTEQDSLRYHIDPELNNIKSQSEISTNVLIDFRPTDYIWKKDPGVGKFLTAFSILANLPVLVRIRQA